MAVFLSLSSQAMGQDASEIPAYSDRVAQAMVVVPGGLTADAAAQRAVTSAPSVDTRLAEIDLSKASQSSTLARYVPQLTLTASVTRNNRIDFDFGGGGLAVGALNPGQLSVGACSDGSGNNCVVDAMGSPVGAVASEPFDIPRNNYSLQAQLNVPISDYLLQLPSARRASAADLSAANHRLENERGKVGHDARLAYYEWLRARAQVAIADESLVSVRARLADARVNLAGGTVAPADVLQIESLEASSQVAIVNAKSYEELARQNLGTLMGVESIEFKVGEDVLASDLAPIEEDLQVLIAGAKKRRHDLRSLAASETSAVEAASSASTGLYPRLDAFGTVNHANPNQQFFPPEDAWKTSWSIGLSASWGLDRFFTSRAQRNELRANAKIFASQLRSAQRGATIEITVAWQEWKRASASVKLSEIDLKAAEASYGQRVALYRAGEATTSEVVAAEVQRFDASLRSINSRIDLRVARAKLRRAAALESTE